MPVLIMTYYAVIGGWITKYAVVRLSKKPAEAATDGYFTSFITSTTSPVVYALLFMGVTAVIVYNGGRKKGNRKSKKYRWMMPILLVVVGHHSCVLAIFKEHRCIRPGQYRCRKVSYITVLGSTGLTVHRFLQILLDAMSQLFFSLSVSMGIMITYGSYVNQEVNLNKAINQIEV